MLAEMRGRWSGEEEVGGKVLAEVVGEEKEEDEKEDAGEVVGEGEEEDEKEDAGEVVGEVLAEEDEKEDAGEVSLPLYLLPPL